jgi:hypothetical protein
MPAGRADTLVGRVLSAVGIYDALGLAPSVSHKETHRVYRKVCLQLHPDKCKHPKATEAFQQLGAFMIEMEKLAELTGSANGEGYTTSYEQRRPTASHEWEEGSDCGSWGGESSDEEGFWNPVEDGVKMREAAVKAGLGAEPEPPSRQPPTNPSAPSLKATAGTPEVAPISSPQPQVQQPQVQQPVPQVALPQPQPQMQPQMQPQFQAPMCQMIMLPDGTYTYAMSMMPPAGFVLPDGTPSPPPCGPMLMPMMMMMPPQVCGGVTAPIAAEPAPKAAEPAPSRAELVDPAPAHSSRKRQRGDKGPSPSSSDADDVREVDDDKRWQL